MEMNKLLEKIASLEAQLSSMATSQGLATDFQASDHEEHTYHHRIPGSTVVVMRKGANNSVYADTLSFGPDGSLTTSDPVVNSFLRPLVDVAGTSVYSKHNTAPDPLTEKAAGEVKKIAERSIDKLGAEAR